MSSSQELLSTSIGLISDSAILAGPGSPWTSSPSLLLVFVEIAAKAYRIDCLATPIFTDTSLTIPAILVNRRAALAALSFRDSGALDFPELVGGCVFFIPLGNNAFADCPNLIITSLAALNDGIVQNFRKCAQKRI